MKRVLYWARFFCFCWGRNDIRGLFGWGFLERVTQGCSSFPAGVEKVVGGQVERFMKEKTGFAIGGVSPVIQDATIKVIIDEDLLQYEDIWGAAGHPKAVFQMTPVQLIELTDGEVLNIKG